MSSSRKKRIKNIDTKNKGATISLRGPKVTPPQVIKSNEQIVTTTASTRKTSLCYFVWVTGSVIVLRLGLVPACSS